MIAIYARQSVDKKDSISINSQIEFCKKELNYDDQYKTYTDKGFSGSTTNRPAFEQLLSDISLGLISKVIVYKLDRISRSILDFSRVIELFRQYSVEFVSATEKFDTSTPIGNAMLNITMIFAQLERETIQSRIKDNYYSRGKKGFFLGGKTPFGFTKEPFSIDNIKTSILKADLITSQIVRQIFEDYTLPSTSLGTITTMLNSENIKSPNGVHWDSTKVQRILRNPVYVKADATIYQYFNSKECNIVNELSEFIGVNGCFLFGKRVKQEGKYTNIKNHVLALSHHEGIIPSNTWLKCQYKLDENKQIKNSGKSKYSWLSGLTKCGYCGYAMTVTKYKEYKYLICRGKTNYKICKKIQRTHYLEIIESYVEKELLKKLKSYSIPTNIPEKESSYELNQIRIKIIDINSQIELLLEQIIEKNSITNKYIHQKIEQLHTKKEDLQTLLNTQPTSITPQLDTLKSHINKTDYWSSLSLSNKKLIAHSFIDKILISNSSIIILWWM